MRKVFILFVPSIVIVVIVIAYFDSNKKQENQKEESKLTALEVSVSLPTETLVSSGPEKTPEGGWQTFRFNNLHGVMFDTLFEFQYPSSWHNDGQYFSPQPIQYYDISSPDAPMYYDLVAEDLFESSDLKYQIDIDKRNRPDTKIKIGGKDFRKYDLIDYGAYRGGESAGRVVIFIGPKININGKNYYLVFRWEERPLTITVPGNDLKIFEQMIATLKFH